MAIAVLGVSIAFVVIGIGGLYGGGELARMIWPAFVEGGQGTDTVLVTPKPHR